MPAHKWNSLRVMKLLGVVMILVIMVAWCVRGGGLRTRWDDRFGFNVWVVDDGEVSLLSFRGKEKALLIRFEGNTVIPVVDSEGEIKLSSVNKYAESNKDGRKMMKKSLDRWMRVMSDGLYWEMGEVSIDKVLLSRSSLLPVDRLKMVWWLIRGKKIDEVKIEGETETTIDAQEVSHVNIDKLIRQYRDWWAEDEILSDKRRVSLEIRRDNLWMVDILSAAGVVVVDEKIVDEASACTIKLPESDDLERGIPAFLVKKFGCEVLKENSGDLEIGLVL